MPRLPLLIAAAIVAVIVAASFMLLNANHVKNQNVNVNALAGKCITLKSINKTMIAIVSVRECSYCSLVKQRVHVYEIMLVENGKVVCKRRVDIPLRSGSALVYLPCFPKAPGVYKICVKLSTGETICEKNVLFVVMR
ncbi:MAG: hypothetical protein GXO10_03110 [Crenarchaeota archaeon]|nr:hypothetical protein [Thermoproteota archaeon]